MSIDTRAQNPQIPLFALHLAAVNRTEESRPVPRAECSAIPKLVHSRPESKAPSVPNSATRSLSDRLANRVRLF